jgi:serine/threonine protein kinase
MSGTQRLPPEFGPQLRCGLQIGPYVVRSLLRADRLEVAYRAHDSRHERDVMLVLSQSARGSRRFAGFLDRWRTGALICHPHIVAVYDFGWHDGRPFLISELLEGTTLRALLASGPIPPVSAARFAMQIADGLHAAHRAGIVHGALRPENVWVSPPGHTRILNFASARTPEERLELVQQAASETPAAARSVAYLSPEQVTARTIDLRTDIFSLGVMLYEMVTGVPPFGRRTPIDTLRAISADVLPEARHDDPAVVELVERIVRRTVEKDPADRLPSAKALFDRLELLLPSLGAPVPPPARVRASAGMLSRVRDFFAPRELRLR